MHNQQCKQQYCSRLKILMLQNASHIYLACVHRQLQLKPTTTNHIRAMPLTKLRQLAHCIPSFAHRECCKLWASCKSAQVDHTQSNREHPQLNGENRGGKLPFKGQCMLRVAQTSSPVFYTTNLHDATWNHTSIQKGAEHATSMQLQCMTCHCAISTCRG